MASPQKEIRNHSHAVQTRDHLEMAQESSESAASVADYERELRYGRSGLMEHEQTAPKATAKLRAKKAGVKKSPLLSEERPASEYEPKFVGGGDDIKPYRRYDDTRYRSAAREQSDYYRGDYYLDGGLNKPLRREQSS